ncbi:hypothetical protein EVJ50_11060 [Synechococcus sp. RSCCF101]|uniref:hypothetical protein n=1 Tax=Synechococcus sp. RSCCF101 TaxID=2511069 RepID=UPI0012439CE9|nr:hypothetical protein [Synechococcus sp. RSCCF101]QEY32682.1 hypothetical protein EVJ50_11060 [Synechococcus sp. RSCCF101]
MALLQSCALAASALLATGVPIELPPHTATEEPLQPSGRRIVVRVDRTEISREQCRALIAAVRHRAGADGQVIVQKPSRAIQRMHPDAPTPDTVVPWCVDNLDGDGVVFTDTNLFWKH